MYLQGRLKGTEIYVLCLIHLQVLASGSWTLLLEDNGPSARSAHAAALDNNQFWIHAGKGEDLLQDLWVYNKALQTWTLVPLFTAAPSARKEHLAITDGNGDLWVHGGQDDEVYFNDLWKLHTNQWTLISNASVPGRSSHIGVWDSPNDALWIHGGYDGELKQDMWKFDAQRGRWFSITDSNNRPSARAHHVAALDETNEVIWIHGGYDGGLCQDLWKFDTQTYGWNWISSGGPSARAHHVAVWDTINQALWIHGGFDGVACRDLWRFETLTYTWSFVTESGPSARFDHVAVWDARLLAMVVHGGYDQGLHRDMWSFEVPIITTTVTNTRISTTSSQTTFTTSSSTSSTSTILSSSDTTAEDSGDGLPSHVLALILVLSVLGFLACCLALYLYKRHKNREAVVPLPPPLPPPVPPPPPSPKSPQLRVNTQLLLPPPNPQPRTAVPSHSPLSPPIPRQLPPVFFPSMCDADTPPLTATDVRSLKLHSVHSVHCAPKPKTPGRTESAPHLPTPSLSEAFSPRGVVPNPCSGHISLGRESENPMPRPSLPTQCQVCGRCKKVAPPM